MIGRNARLALVTALAGAALTAAPAAAQDSGLRPLEGLGGWLGDDDFDDEGPADPLAPGPAAQPPAPELTPAERRQRERQIERNYDDAQNTYQEIIGADPLGPLERRIANNERIVREYRERINAGQQERRQLQVDLFNRTFYLKQQLERGQINREVYERLIAAEERKFEEQGAQARRNLDAWTKEVQAAQARLDDLKAQRRMIQAQRPRPQQQQRGARGQPAPQPRPGERLVGSLQDRLERLKRFHTRNTLDGMHPRDVGGGGRSLGLPGGDGLGDEGFGAPGRGAPDMARDSYGSGFDAEAPPRRAGVDDGYRPGAYLND